jgi:acetylornithine deacetylase/succinyl-diaminopimelate desuccinylase-like protein
LTPFLFQAGTDALARHSRVRHLSVPDHRGELTRMHGNDERVGVESLRQGTEMIDRTLVDVAGS